MGIKDQIKSAALATMLAAGAATADESTPESTPENTQKNASEYRLGHNNGVCEVRQEQGLDAPSCASPNALERYKASLKETFEICADPDQQQYQPASCDANAAELKGWNDATANKTTAAIEAPQEQPQEQPITSNPFLGGLLN